jgi:hypothetical protein
MLMVVRVVMMRWFGAFFCSSEMSHAIVESLVAGRSANDTTMDRTNNDHVFMVTGIIGHTPTTDTIQSDTGTCTPLDHPTNPNNQRGTIIAQPAAHAIGTVRSKVFFAILPTSGNSSSVVQDGHLICRIVNY